MNCLPSCNKAMRLWNLNFNRELTCKKSCVLRSAGDLTNRNVVGTQPWNVVSCLPTWHLLSKAKLTITVASPRKNLSKLVRRLAVVIFDLNFSRYAVCVVCSSEWWLLVCGVWIVLLVKVLKLDVGCLSCLIVATGSLVRRLLLPVLKSIWFVAHFWILIIWN